MPLGMNDIYGATLRGLRSEVDRRSASIAKSYHALPNPETGYAKLHREVILVHNEIIGLIDRRLAQRATAAEMERFEAELPAHIQATEDALKRL